LGGAVDGGAAPVRLNSARPTIVVKIAEAVEAALQLIRPRALLFRDAAPRHISTPAEVRLRIIDPRRSSQTATEALVGIGLDDGDPRIDFAICSLPLNPVCLRGQTETKCRYRGRT
jgi:hypothetical protein